MTQESTDSNHTDVSWAIPVTNVCAVLKQLFKTIMFGMP